MPRPHHRTDSRPVNCARTLIAIATIVVVCGGRMAGASDDAIATRLPAACETAAPRLPEAIQIPEYLRSDVEVMLKRSPTFRRQCLRLADAVRLRVLVKTNAAIVDRTYRARSVITRARSGRILVLVELSPFGSPVEWIAHEFEHVLEQLDGVRLAALARRTGQVWRSADGMFETERAIRAGRAVVAEMRARRQSRPDKLVE